jgi:hypothetical protein
LFPFSAVWNSPISWKAHSPVYKILALQVIFMDWKLLWSRKEKKKKKKNTHQWCSVFLVASACLVKKL